MRVALVLLALVATGCASSAQSGASPKGVVRGVVLAAPSCPVERAASPCPPRPVAGATVTLLAANDAQIRTVADGSGRFSATLPPGPYEVTATNPGIRTTAHVQVTVSPGATSSVRLVVDSGIR